MTICSPMARKRTGGAAPAFQRRCRLARLADRIRKCFMTLVRQAHHRRHSTIQSLAKHVTPTVTAADLLKSATLFLCSSLSRRMEVSKNYRKETWISAAVLNVSLRRHLGIQISL